MAAFICWAGTCMEESWLRVPMWTPSAPSSLHVSSDVFHQMDGDLLPVIRVEWKVATDGKWWLFNVDMEQRNKV